MSGFSGMSHVKFPMGQAWRSKNSKLPSLIKFLSWKTHRMIVESPAGMWIHTPSNSSPRKQKSCELKFMRLGCSEFQMQWFQTCSFQGFLLKQKWLNTLFQYVSDNLNQRTMYTYDMLHSNLVILAVNSQNTVTEKKGSTWFPILGRML